MIWSNISSDLPPVQPWASHPTSESASRLSEVGEGWTGEVNQTGPALTEPAGVGSPREVQQGYTQKEGRGQAGENGLQDTHDQRYESGTQAPEIRCVTRVPPLDPGMQGVGGSSQPRWRR